jgi:hypothetical protein
LGIKKNFRACGVIYIAGTIFEFENRSYLSEFVAEFKKALVRESGAQGVLFDEKPKVGKSRDTVPLSHTKVAQSIFKRTTLIVIALKKAVQKCCRRKRRRIFARDNPRQLSSVHFGGSASFWEKKFRSLYQIKNNEGTQN